MSRISKSFFVELQQEYRLALGRIGNNSKSYLMASTFVAFAMGVQLVLLNLYLLGLGFHEDMVGQVAASISLGVAVGGIPAGFFYDRFSGKLSFIIATAGMMMTMFLLSLSNQKVLLVIWAFINGLAESMFFSRFSLISLNILLRLNGPISMG